MCGADREAQLAQAGGLAVPEVAAPQGGAIRRAAVLTEEHGILRPGAVAAVLEALECLGGLLDHRDGARRARLGVLASAAAVDLLP